jgi:hypothetical protein
MKSIQIEEDHFGIEPEIVAKLARTAVFHQHQRDVARRAAGPPAAENRAQPSRHARAAVPALVRRPAARPTQRVGLAVRMVFPVLQNELGFRLRQGGVARGSAGIVPHRARSAPACGLILECLHPRRDFSRPRHARRTRSLTRRWQFARPHVAQLQRAGTDEAPRQNLQPARFFRYVFAPPFALVVVLLAAIFMLARASAARTD